MASSGTGAFTYDVTAPAGQFSGSGAFSYDVTAVRGSGTFSYDVTAPAAVVQLIYRRTGLGTEVPVRIGRRTGLGTEVVYGSPAG